MMRLAAATAPAATTAPAPATAAEAEDIFAIKASRCRAEVELLLFLAKKCRFQKQQVDQ